MEDDGELDMEFHAEDRHGNMIFILGQESILNHGAGINYNRAARSYREQFPGDPNPPFLASFLK